MGKEMPQFAHLPLLLKADGNGKLSKRDADKAGFPIFPINWTDSKTKEFSTGFRENGYLPEALLNFLAFLGWNPGTEQEIFSMSELTVHFPSNVLEKAVLNSTFIRHSGIISNIFGRSLTRNLQNIF